MMKGKIKHYTFALIPHHPKKGMRFIKVPSVLVNKFTIISALLAIIFAGSLLYNIILTARLTGYELTIARVRERGKKVDSIIQESDNIKKAILELHERNNELRKMLGLKTQKPSIIVASAVDNEFLESLSPEEQRVFKIIKQASVTARLDTKDLEKLKEHVAEVYKKITSVPSKWPIYGTIVSGFGYRVSPWRGMHTGIDIKAKYGDIIRATAPGVVSYVGWRAGYGRTVEIKHEYGFSTLYAHCSRLLVKNSDQIESGQIIGRVGVSGYSTGSHLHYEVRKDDRPVNPFAFLDLKMLTAARIMM